MEDQKIVELYWERSEEAIKETDLKYGKYCHYIAYRILYCTEDAEECVNDTYLKAWNTMPPQKPSKLQAFLGKITRNLALNRYEHMRAEKRGETVAQIGDEFWQCVPSEETSMEDEVVLRERINGFLRTLSAEQRIVFLQRYFYFCSVREIAKQRDMTENHVKVMLHRLREQFKVYWETEGRTV